MTKLIRTPPLFAHCQVTPLCTALVANHTVWRGILAREACHQSEDFRTSMEADCLSFDPTLALRLNTIFRIPGMLSKVHLWRLV
jgi:hypothetical protein